MSRISVWVILFSLIFFSACYKDEFDALQKQFDSLNSRLSKLETVDQQIVSINAALNTLQQTQKKTEEDQQKLAKLQILINQISSLKASPAADLDKITQLLTFVNTNIAAKDYDKGIVAMETYLKSVDTSIIQLKDRSKSPNGKNMFSLKPGFENTEIYSLLSSEDVLPLSPNFVYGSLADGNGLLKNGDDTYSLINNLEGDYSVVRITLDRSFSPIRGEYILNAAGSANTAMCSGTLIKPEEHGFGPLYLSGGEGGNGSKPGVYALDPAKKSIYRNEAKILTSMGEWYVENAVTMHKDAYPSQTVVMIGDDHGDDATPQGQFAIYVGARGDLNTGKLYGLRLKNNMRYEAEMKESETYDFEMVELKEKRIDLLNNECVQKRIMGFSRVEDIDYKKGGGANGREVYFAVTGRKSNGLIGKGTTYGRIYKLNFDENSPLSGKISPVLDGDNLTGKAKAFHSPDNVLVTENYVYIQEDPNGYPDTPDKTHFAQVYQYNIKTGELKTVLECDQMKAAALGYGISTKLWEITGMVDISETIGVPNTFIMITQNHGWDPKDGSSFTDPDASVKNYLLDQHREGSMMFIVKGLAR